MASARKKLDEKHLKILRELVSLPSNKHCFDCHQRGPTYVNVTIGSFVCTTCSGLLRGLTPPHRVKSISMATFSPEEIELVKSRGNEYCRRVWLGLCDTEQPTKDEQQIKDFMISKYEKKRYYIEPTEDLKILVNRTSNQSSPGPSPPNSAAPLTTSLSTKPPILNNGHVRNSQATTISALTINTSINNGNSSGGPFTPSKAVGIAKRAVVDDPFSPITSSTPPPSENINQPSFANFDDNPIFSASSSAPASTGGRDSLGDLRGLDMSSWSNSAQQHQQHQATATVHNRWSTLLTSEFLPFSSPWETSLPSSSLPNNRWSYGGGVIPSSVPPTEDRYAALKDLDCLMKTQKASEQTSSSTAVATEWSSPHSNGIWPTGVFNQAPSSAETNKTSVSSNPFAGDNGWSEPTQFVGNPFKSPRNQSEISWPLTNGQQVNGFPTSQSLNFGPATVPWKVEPVTNPFTVGVSSQVKIHHSSNPFL